MPARQASLDFTVDGGLSFSRGPRPSHELISHTAHRREDDDRLTRGSINWSPVMLEDDVRHISEASRVTYRSAPELVYDHRPPQFTR